MPAIGLRARRTRRVQQADLAPTTSRVYLPTILTGRGNGLLRLGRWVKFPAETPLANLHLTMAQQMGVPAESFADSTGKLRELTDV
jgi:hypothetical protein